MTPDLFDTPDYGGDLEYDDPELTALDGLHDFVRAADLDNVAFALHQWHTDATLDTASCLAGYVLALIENSSRKEL